MPRWGENGSEIEVEVRVDQLRRGVRYLANGNRVSFVIVADDVGIHLQDVGPV